MFKNIFYIFCLLFSFIFFYFVIDQYLSGKNVKLINKNRNNIEHFITHKSKNLKILKNDTNDVIEFNSGYNNEDSKPQRRFWELFIN